MRNAPSKWRNTLSTTMNTIETSTIPPLNLREIEARAHQLRAEAFNSMLRALFRAIFSAPRKMVSCPTCARPLRG
ncbi:RSP_7527 family protein [Cribrihabitans neustonicus]|uniref:RSP_7527 family protein n=1 Tax=Cribrihabitans neustonicus TaxID=1429085 RepID=UPI003B5C4EAD